MSEEAKLGWALLALFLAFSVSLVVFSIALVVLVLR
jgi:hypothetical protein